MAEGDGAPEVKHPPFSTISVVVGGGSLSQWQGLTRCFSKDHGFVLIRCSDDVSEVFSYCQRLIPCVLIVDQSFLQKVAPAEFGNLVDVGRAIQVLVRSEREDPRSLESLLRLGCMGFLAEGNSAATLRRAVCKVATGELWASRKLISQTLRRLLLAKSQRTLTAREIQILKLIASGCKNKEIAEQLTISHDTVRWHVRTLYAKIGVRDRLSASIFGTQYAVEEWPGFFYPEKKPSLATESAGLSNRFASRRPARMAV